MACAMAVRGADWCDQLVNDGGDATLLMHQGTRWEALYAKDETLPDPESSAHPSSSVSRS